MARRGGKEVVVYEGLKRAGETEERDPESPYVALRGAPSYYSTDWWNNVWNLRCRREGMRGEGEGERGEGEKDLSFVVANAHPNAPQKVSKVERDTNDYNMYNKNTHTHSCISRYERTTFFS